MNYQESLDYLLKYADYERLPRSGIVWDIKRIERLLSRLGNPHNNAKSVHVAGTKGKGSTASMIASVLKSAGYKVGLYTSPHLLSYTERIRIDGKSIDEAAWARLVETIQPHVEAENALGDLGQLTTFEIFTAMAFLHFAEEKVDWQVMEVGLGGRLDATNVIHPEVCVITSISLDHMDVLGNTLAKIAREKCGIIKPEADVVSAPQFPEAMKVVEEVCEEKRVRLIRVGQDVTWERAGYNQEAQSFKVKGLLGEYKLRIRLVGEHQLENAANAVAAVEQLRKRGAKIATKHIVEGMWRVEWRGRLEILRKKPWLVVDGAHNAYSIMQMGMALSDYFKYNRLKLILGFGNDKDIAGMAEEAVKITKDIIVVASKHPRAVGVGTLAEAFMKEGVKPRIADSVAEAIGLAMEDAKPNDLICAAGSIFVIAELLEGMGGGQ
ncbi:MAG: bifunctional folylpolyglutamate synthase/dihydrofolate synthase [Dehalococcoidales bacterium]|nr:bifunctional folylpolyglutamate synthase/dihydrofolate synthase [Dehalococcoidales bacterium]